MKSLKFIALSLLISGGVAKTSFSMTDISTDEETTQQMPSGDAMIDPTDEETTDTDTTTTDAETTTMPDEDTMPEDTEETTETGPDY